MYAVIKTGGKQYRVAKDDTVVVEKLLAEPGETVELGNVLMIGGTDKAPVIGTPSIDKAAVFAEVLDQTRNKKIMVFKKKRRQNYRRTRGHRQNVTVLRILEISESGKLSAAAKPKAAAAKPKVEAKESKPKAAAKATPKAAAKPAAKTTKKTAVKTKAPAKAKPAAKASSETAAKKTPAKKTAAKKTPAKKTAAKKKD